MNEYQNLKRLYLKAKEILERSTDPNDREAESLRCFPVEYYENLRNFVDMVEDSGIKLVVRKVN